MEERQRVQEIVQQLNIIDDTLFQKMAEDEGFCEEMISTILQQKIGFVKTFFKKIYQILLFFIFLLILFR